MPDVPKLGPINDCALYRHIILFAIATLQKIRPYEGSVLMLTDRICVKYGKLVDLTEALTMRFISQNTSIPVPQVLCAFTHRNCTYIVMESIKGIYIGAGWVHRSEESKAKILTQLKSMVEEMRKLPPPAGMGVGSVVDGSLYDGRVPGTSLRFGPFASVQEFHRHLRGGMDFDPRLDPAVQELIRQHDKSFPIAFTRGDLSSLNILARGDTIVGIVDWETAGWYPSYWEYTTACQVNPQNSFWINEIDKFITPLPDELAMERTRQKYFGDY
ncbi:uncharacterized protein AKAW2_40638S [Aspergillus luchuensis]|uniref:Serine/threonine protein kinase n=1 Tax=Aspergillus kawachii TaxID=1069201 RepID=A0A146FR10_ASPKA|nr:uncharacterized protein AKAW2_40638S [Aspergillus luchuensis]BCR98955.1 hypothetical protein AKAW2_40638S [Aspergillus luchuensis]GAA88191.1 serine/threonine protein kinase [Aspergillus luchuensis IFO 4308]GAT27699.1 serine/threonine protein kinase [Aspergillus luchuensis]